MLKSLLVKDYMSETLIRFKPETEVFEAADKLIEYKLTGAPVVDEHQRVIGFLSEKDCLKTILSAAYLSDHGATVRDLMMSPVKTVDPEDSIVEVAEKFFKDNCRMYPVLDEEVLVGFISRRDILRALEVISTPERSS
ncbi:MAG: signal transduction protein [Kangiellaceae bacterium]|jgi:CBS domain-containing protein|nr:signal transduction protein [Kangiellaceae bacterium]